MKMLNQRKLMFKNLMVKIFITLVFTSTLSISFAEVPEQKPVLEAVPAPTVEKTEPASKVDQDAASKSEDTDLGLIKTEKNLQDKNCKVVLGKVLCKNKKNVKRKTI
jgi:hypothetical protein